MENRLDLEIHPHVIDGANGSCTLARTSCKLPTCPPASCATVDHNCRKRQRLHFSHHGEHAQQRIRGVGDAVVRPGEIMVVVDDARLLLAEFDGQSMEVEVIRHLNSLDCMSGRE